jgi:hypothetical protein
MLEIPIANDQPGVAARLAWSSSSALVPLQRTIDRLWNYPSCQQNAQRWQQVGSPGLPMP